MRVLQRSRPLAVILIVLTMLGTTATWHTPDDPDCFSGIVLHDHSAHHARFGAPAPSDGPEHCAICHWLQSFRIDGARQAWLPSASDQYVRFTSALHATPASAATIAIAPRAPPRA